MHITLKKFFLFFLIIPFWGNGQTIPLNKYTESDGLPHSVVYRIFQDKDNYLWLSTDNGLSRFDGAEFLNYNSEDGLESNFVFDIIQKDNSSIEIAAFSSGIIRFNTKTRKFSKVIDAKSTGFPIDFLQTRKGKYIFNNHNDVYLLNKDGHTLKMVSKKITSGIELKSGEVLFAGSNGVRFENGKFLYYDSANYTHQIIELRENIILLFCSDKIIQFNLKTKKVEQEIQTVIEGRKPAFKDKKDCIWFADKLGRVWRFTKDLKSKELIYTDVLVNQFYEDTEGKIWIATYGQGLWCIPNKSIKNSKIRGELYSGFKVILDKDKSEKLVTFKQYLFSVGPSFFKQKQNSLSGIDFYNNDHGLIYYDQDVIIYCSGKFLVFESEKIKFNLDFGENKNIITQIEKHTKHQYIVATRNGLYELDICKKTISRISKIGSRIIYDISVDDKRIAIATSEGVFVFDKVWYRISGCSSVVNTVALIKDKSEFYIGTSTGIFSANFKTKKARKIKGFENNTCNDIIADKSEKIWFALNTGLLLKKSNGFVFFGSNDGVKGGGRKIFYLKEKDKLFLMYYNLFSELTISDLLNKSNSSKKKVFIDYIKSNNKKYYPKSGKIIFKKSVKNIVIKVNTPLTQNTNEKKLYYSINGSDKTSFSNFGQLSLVNLENGNNKIKIFFVNNNVLVATVQLNIENPYPIYLHPLSILFYVLFGFLISVIIINRSIRKVLFIRKKQHEAKEQLWELRQKSLLNMLNPHFLNNAINSIQAFVVKNDQRNTLRYLSRLAKLMRVNLDLLEKSFVSLRKEISSIELYVQFEQIRSENKFEFRIDIQENLNIDEVLIPSFVIQPFIENAIWHGVLPSEKKCLIELKIVKISDKHIKIIIEDDGIGLLQSQANKTENPTKISRGTNIIKERLAILNDSKTDFGIQLEDFSKIGKSGTQVTLIVPFQTIKNGHS